MYGGYIKRTVTQVHARVQTAVNDTQIESKRKLENAIKERYLINLFRIENNFELGARLDRLGLKVAKHHARVRVENTMAA